jgi:hypothetical protein
MSRDVRCGVCGRLFATYDGAVHEVRCWRFNHGNGTCWWSWCEDCRIDSEHRPKALNASDREIKERIERIGQDLERDNHTLKPGLFRDQGLEGF